MKKRLRGVGYYGWYREGPGPRSPGFRIRSGMTVGGGRPVGVGDGG